MLLEYSRFRCSEGDDCWGITVNVPIGVWWCDIRKYDLSSTKGKSKQLVKSRRNTDEYRLLVDYEDVKNKLIPRKDNQENQNNHNSECDKEEHKEENDSEQNINKDDNDNNTKTVEFQEENEL